MPTDAAKKLLCAPAGETPASSWSALEPALLCAATTTSPPPSDATTALLCSARREGAESSKQSNRNSSSMQQTRRRVKCLPASTHAMALGQPLHLLAHYATENTIRWTASRSVPRSHMARWDAVNSLEQTLPPSPCRPYEQPIASSIRQTLTLPTFVRATPWPSGPPASSCLTLSPSRGTALGTYMCGHGTRLRQSGKLRRVLASAPSDHR